MDFSQSHPDYFGDDAARPRGLLSARGVDGLLPGLVEAPVETSPEGSFEKHWLKTLAHVLIEEVQELHSAEKQLSETLPNLTTACSDPILRAICETHFDSAREHLRRIQLVQNILGQSPDGRTNQSMEGLVLGLHETIAENHWGSSRDAALIVVVRKIKHYESAAYCSARDFAQLLGLGPVAEILQKTLDDEITLEAKFANLGELMTARG